METIIHVCTGKSCSEKFSKYILSRLESDKKFYNYSEKIEIKEHICMWKCKEWPNIKINSEIFLSQNPIKSSEILKKKVEDWKNTNLL